MAHGNFNYNQVKEKEPFLLTNAEFQPSLRIKE